MSHGGQSGCSHQEHSSFYRGSGRVEVHARRRPLGLCEPRVPAGNLDCRASRALAHDAAQAEQAEIGGRPAVAKARVPFVASVDSTLDWCERRSGR
jgi:hypothetical protein